jgi:predicted ATP-dependent endonuclease of OLD family
MVRKMMSDSNPPRLLSFTLDGWPVLGGPVTISLNDGVAVLVGRNGAGKSAILEGFKAISAFVMGENNRILYNDDDVPTILTIEILTPSNRRLQYRYERLTVSSKNSDINTLVDNDLERTSPSLDENCQYLDQAQELIWKTTNGVTVVQSYPDQPIILGYQSFVDLINLSQTLKLKLPDEQKWVRSVLKGVRLVGKYPIRISSGRHLSRLEVINTVPQASKGWRFSREGEYPNVLTYIIHNIGNDELELICQRIGLGNKITEKKFPRNGQDYDFEVELDGVNIGLLSDGTLRVLSILVEIISSYLSSTIMIEEPETQTHPGMLEKLLNEIESYTYGQNLILSTHSPQVVSWTDPDKINLVYRENGRTFVRKLGADEIHNVADYLNEEGDLGDWIYSGILDD